MVIVNLVREVENEESMENPFVIVKVILDASPKAILSSLFAVMLEKVASTKVKLYSSSTSIK